MACRLLAPALTFLCLFVMAVHATLPSEEYWNSMLPGTPMPRAITNALRPGHGVKQVMIAAGNEDYGNHKYIDNRERMVVAAGNSDYGNTKYSINRADLLKGQKLAAADNKKYGNSDYSRKTIAVNPPTALYFLESDLYAGKVMKMEINRREAASGFVPRRISVSIPFSSDKMLEVFNRFGIRPGSESGKMMTETVKECEGVANKGEVKQCVTSLESMVDFVVHSLGKKVRAVSTVADKDGKIQNFEMRSGVEKLADDEVVVCHKDDYPYAVFYCHALKGTRSYLVPLSGADGAKAEAVAVCHVDTSAWNPEHVALKVLNVKPGAVPVCHFLPEYDVVWTRK